jgi:hypothetical protein
LKPGDRIRVRILRALEILRLGPPSAAQKPDLMGRFKVFIHGFDAIIG